ncbi:MAG: hypothetical protein NTV79_11565 [Candidatus Aureabacteria bacterium]|nr:hypothetical protein [Candidatus Auribacterota bacterium]
MLAAGMIMAFSFRFHSFGYNLSNAETGEIFPENRGVGSLRAGDRRLYESLGGSFPTENQKIVPEDPDTGIEE